ncbi:phospho-sugar mutase [Acholeplasma sp. OttesenSCG-928-E16]|nr:phospho-sugar mutase [Acholeplasma sp. OttesenSCG-928-E16]
MTYLDKYLNWKNNENLEPHLKEELLSLSQEQIKEAFYTDLAFGTGGLRGIMGVGTNRINTHVIRKATLGFARYLIKKYNERPLRVAISYDNRNLSYEFALTAARVLAENNIESHVFPELRPTPLLSYAVRYLKAHGGIMITASHNPKEYNGYKVYNETGAQLNLEESNEVINEINKIDSYFNILEKDDKNLIKMIDTSLEKSYLELVKNIHYNKTSKKAKIVYSPLHGTGGKVIVPLLKEVGYDVVPYLPQMINDPNFSATKSSNPEDKITYDVLIEFAKKVDAKAILVTDPDADRLGVAVLHDNDFHLINGNQTAALELYYLLKNTKDLDKNSFVFTTIVTSDLIKELAFSFGLKAKETLTGFKFIGEQAASIEGKSSYFFGCEESYGSLIRDFVRDKDAVQAVFLLAEMINYLADNNKTLIDYLETIYQEFGYYYEWTNQVSLKGIEGAAKIVKIMEHYRNNPLNIDGFELLYHDDFEHSKRYYHDHFEIIDLPKSNVVKFVYNDNLWVTFRPSGTEPKIKIYFGVKSDSKDSSKALVNKINEKIIKTIDNL